MQRDQIEAVANSLLDSFNSGNWEQLEGLFDRAAEVDEANHDRSVTTGPGIVARFRELKGDAPGIVGAADHWVIDTEQGTAAAEVGLSVADRADRPQATATIFLRVSDDGLITSIREQHIRRGIDRRYGCMICHPPDPNGSDGPIVNPPDNNGSDGPIVNPTGPDDGPGRPGVGPGGTAPEVNS